LVEPAVRESDECGLVNEIIAWRLALGSVISPNEYLDFTGGTSSDEMASLALAVNNSFASFNMPHRVDHANGVMVPRFEMKGVK
jgi:hypothetical protein